MDGPITANNPMGVHHAWGRSLKDIYQRYNAMKGYDQRYQNGFDCQGLWVTFLFYRKLKFRFSINRRGGQMRKLFKIQGITTALVFSAIMFALVACEGSAGATGPAGPAGPAGADGAARVYVHRLCT